MRIDDNLWGAPRRRAESRTLDAPPPYGRLHSGPGPRMLQTRGRPCGPLRGWSKPRSPPRRRAGSSSSRCSTGPPRIRHPPRVRPRRHIEDRSWGPVRVRTLYEVGPPRLPRDAPHPELEISSSTITRTTSRASLERHCPTSLLRRPSRLNNTTTNQSAKK